MRLPLRELALPLQQALLVGKRLDLLALRAEPVDHHAVERPGGACVFAEYGRGIDHDRRALEARLRAAHPGRRRYGRAVVVARQQIHLVEPGGRSHGHRDYQRIRVAQPRAQDRLALRVVRVGLGLLACLALALLLLMRFEHRRQRREEGEQTTLRQSPGIDRIGAAACSRVQGDRGLLGLDPTVQQVGRHDRPRAKPRHRPVEQLAPLQRVEQPAALHQERGLGLLDRRLEGLGAGGDIGRRAGGDRTQPPFVLCPPLELEPLALLDRVCELGEVPFDVLVVAVQGVGIGTKRRADRTAGCDGARLALERRAAGAEPDWPVGIGLGLAGLGDVGQLVLQHARHERRGCRTGEKDVAPECCRRRAEGLQAGRDLGPLVQARRAEAGAEARLDRCAQGSRHGCAGRRRARHQEARHVAPRAGSAREAGDRNRRRRPAGHACSALLSRLGLVPVSGCMCGRHMTLRSPVRAQTSGAGESDERPAAGRCRRQGRRGRRRRDARTRLR